MGSNHISRLIFVLHFFFNCALFFFSFLNLVFFFFSFYICQHFFSSFFFIVSKFISIFQCKKYEMNLKLRLRQLCLSSNSLHHCLLSLYLSKKLFHQFLSRNHLRQILSLRFIVSAFLGLPKGSNQRYPPSFSNHLIHCTTLSWLQTLCVKAFSLLSITTQTCVPFYKEESMIHNNVKAECSLFTYT